MKIWHSSVFSNCASVGTELEQKGTEIKKKKLTNNGTENKAVPQRGSALNCFVNQIHTWVLFDLKSRIPAIHVIQC